MAPSTLPLFKLSFFSWLVIDVLQEKYFSKSSDTIRPFPILIFLQIQLPFLLVKHYHSGEKGMCVHIFQQKHLEFANAE